jgi:hypothetical protein
MATNWDDYNFGDLDRDTKVGKHDFEVTEIVLGAWPDGRERYTFRGVLTTAGMAKTDLTLSPPESAAVIKEEPDEKRRMAMLINARNVKRLEDAGFTLEGIKEGDTMHVRTARDKPREGYDVGFVRVREVLGKAKNSEAADKSIPGF